MFRIIALKNPVLDYRVVYGECELHFKFYLDARGIGKGRYSGRFDPDDEDAAIFRAFLDWVPPIGHIRSINYLHYRHRIALLY